MLDRRGRECPDGIGRAATTRATYKAQHGARKRGSRRARSRDMTSRMTNIAVIGTGNVGGNLGARLSTSGFPVRFGVKDDKNVKELLARCAKDASASSVEDAVRWADVIFFAVPGDVAVPVVRSLAPHLAKKIVVDCNNALQWDEGPVWTPPPEGSLAAALQKAAPSAHVVKGWNTFGAETHGDPRHAGAPATVFLAGDDAPSKKTLSEIASRAGFVPVDAGPLRNAGLLENVAILWIHLATVGGQGRGFSLSMVKKS